MIKLVRRFFCVVALITSTLGIAEAAIPVADFSSNITSGCSPIVVNFTDLSTNVPTSWIWDLGNGTISSVQNPSTTYISPGSYTVTLIASNGSGSSAPKVVVSYIIAFPTPTVNFFVDDSASTCTFKAAQFTNTSNPNSGGVTNYYWDFGDGGVSSAVNPSHVYTNPGTYSVTLVVSNSVGCNDLQTKTNYITVLPKPVAGFVLSNNNSCTAPITTTFTNTSIGASNYEWSFGDGGTSTAVSPNHTYNVPGSYTVRLITTSSGGCIDTFVQTAAVNIGNLIAGFTSNLSSACTRNNIIFSNTSVPGAGNSTWYFGDGTTSTQNNPTHAYSLPGTYTVKLVVQYNNCSDSITHIITINNGPVTSFTGSNLNSCQPPLTATFNSSTTGAISYLWNYGDGTTGTGPMSSHTYNSFDSFDVTLIATSSNGCTDTLTKSGYVTIAPPTATISFNGSNGGCIPLVKTFTAAINPMQPILSYSWNFGDGGTGTGASATHTYTTTGVFIVTLTYTTVTGCTNTVTTLMSAGAHSSLAFTANPTTVCLGTPVTFTNSSSFANGYLWDFGDGGTTNTTSPTYRYSLPGVYSVTLYSYSNQCVDTLRKSNLITVQPPLADFLTNYGCASQLDYSFTNTSISATSYLWNFGDGTTSTATNPTHSYLIAGNYTVTLTAYNSATGCSHVKTITLVLQPVVATFIATPTTICVNSPVNFFIPPNPNVSSWVINFGDGITTPLTAGNNYHTYTTAGIYSVKLIATSTNGCRDSLIRNNYITVTGPKANFTTTYVSGCAPIAINFNNTSTVSAGGSIASVLWSFGDDSTSTSTASPINHTYLKSGSYTVRLIVTDINGCKDSIIKTNFININKPISSFYSNNVTICKNAPLILVNTSNGVFPLTYAWDFGDGSASTAASPTHPYTAAGTYTVRLITTDGNGCKDTLVRPAFVTVGSITAAFTVSDTLGFCPPFTVNLTNTSSNAHTYTWNFGNGNSSSGVNPTVIYSTSGTFIITLKAYNTFGCTDSMKRTIHVNPAPSGTFSYTPTSGCLPLTVTFTAAATNTASYTWDFNNGVTQTSASNSITYTYYTRGKFVPKLIISNSNGCTKAIQGLDSLKVSKILSGFTVSPNPVCAQLPVTFTDTSDAGILPITIRNWNFGDGNTGTGSITSHNYALPGTYTARLIAQTTGGCVDTAYRTVVVNPIPIITVSNTAICAGDSTQLIVTGSGVSTYIWASSSSLSCLNCANPYAKPLTTQTYSVTGTGANGCTATKTVTITVNPLPPVNAGSPQTICGGLTAQLTGTGATSYSWTPTIGLSNPNIANPVANPTTTTTYTVVGTSAFGCVNSSQVTITVIPNPALAVTPNQIICSGDSSILTVSGAASYTWSPATGLNTTTGSTVIAKPLVTTTYTVLGNTVTNGCQTAGSVTVTVNPLPVINPGANRAICAGDSTQLTTTGAASYIWTPSTGLSCTTCANPFANPGVTTTYTVTGTSAAGCKDSARITITVNPVPVVTASNSQSICVGSGTTITASGAATYSWSPTTGLSNPNIANPIASPTATTTYTVTGTSGVGCTDTAQVVITVNPKPVVSAGNAQFICPGNNVTLTATGATSYVWSPATGLSSPTIPNPVASPSTTTTYLVTGTDANGCTDTSTVTVNVNGVPVIAIAGNRPLCGGDSTQLTATGANSYTWSPALGLSCSTCANPVAKPATTTTYTITGTSGVGCTGTASIIVTVNQLPQVSAGSPQAICIGATATLAATGASSYVWTPIATLSNSNIANPVATPTATTTYVVTGTSAAGCVKKDSVVITVNPRPVIVATGTAICPGGSGSLNATGAASYVWSPAAGLSSTTVANPVASPATTTTYTVTGTGANGCTNTATATATVNPVPVVNVAGSRSICLGAAGTPLTATGASNYTWTPGTGLSCTACANPTANPTTTTTYTVTGTSGVGCSATTQVTITVNTPPVVTVSPSVRTCAGVPVTLTASGTPNFLWTPAAGLSCTACPNPLATPAATTTYTVTGTDIAGCKDTAMVTVTVDSLPVVNAGRDTTICGLTAARLKATGAVSYVWSPSSTLSNDTIPNPIASPLVTTTYTVIGKGANGCVNRDDVQVSIYTQPPVNAGPDQTICAGQTAQLQASGALTYIWAPTATLSCSNCPNPLALPLANTEYGVIGTDIHGCTDSDKVVITIIQRGPVTVGPGGDICEGESFQLVATGGSSYSWSPVSTLDNGAIANPIATPKTTSTYRVLIKQGNCFTDTLDATVVVHPLPTIHAGPDKNVFAGNSIQINTQVSNVSTYVWSPGDGLSCTTCAEPMAGPEKTTTYTVNVASDFGCLGSDTITIFVTCDGKQLWLPNTFTPNADGQNDRFYPHGRGITTVRRFRIYDRWGELIFDRTNIPVDDDSYGWDGTYQNKTLKPDVYVYIVNAECTTGEPVEIKGDISLIR